MIHGIGSANFDLPLLFDSVGGDVVKLLDLAINAGRWLRKSHSSIRSDRWRGVIRRLESPVEIEIGTKLPFKVTNFSIQEN